MEVFRSRNACHQDQPNGADVGAGGFPSYYDFCAVEGSVSLIRARGLWVLLPAALVGAVIWGCGQGWDGQKVWAGSWGGWLPAEPVACHSSPQPSELFQGEKRMEEGK